ncbi:MAG: metal-sensitive transcriptional regulator [Terrimesophilobacter sp.]
MPTTDRDAQRKIVNRLRRASGQLAAVTAAVEAGQPCRDIVTQLAAVSSAIDRAGFAIVATAMKDCVTDPDEASRKQGNVTSEELEKLFMMLA